MDWKEFQKMATVKMSEFFGTNLTEKNPKGFPKRFDMVSSDGSIVGDAKFLTLVGGTKTPPAKFMEIAGHVWLLERTSAKKCFLVFGNQKEVAVSWLSKYGELVKKVEFYFIDLEGNIEKLN